MPSESDAATESRPESEPTVGELAEALADRVAANGSVRPGIAAELAAERAWHGRMIDVLTILTADAERMAYLTGGGSPEEVMTWLPVWVDSPLSLGEIRTVVAGAGWDPEPFAVVARSGLLERLVYRPDGSLRRVRGELAGAWLSDQFPLADDEQILHAVRQVIDEDQGPFVNTTTAER